MCVCLKQRSGVATGNHAPDQAAPHGPDTNFFVLVVTL